MTPDQTRLERLLESPWSLLIAAALWLLASSVTPQ